MTGIFVELKNMNHQLSNALSTMFLGRLVVLLHLETYAFESVSKAVSCVIPIHQTGFLTRNGGFIRRDGTSCEDV